MEIQDLEPSRKIYIERVGFRGVRRRVMIDTPLGLQHLDLKIELYVDVYERRRGVHLSRSIEALEEVLSGYKPWSLEALLRRVAKQLLAKHPYASRSFASASTTYYVSLSSLGFDSVEPVDARVSVEMGRSYELWTVEVGVTGLTVCPSAQRTIAGILGLGEGDSWKAPSHMQRVRVRGRVTTNRVMVRIEEVAKALFSSLSAPSISLLKRVDEARLVLEAQKRPMFAEDVAREAAYRISMISGLPGDSIVEVEVESLESIHPHDLQVYLKTTANEAKVMGGYKG
ncbi:MAG: GTP cyclohydrolase, FolE2/MptA family [Desulfurococcales archaeon]|nr:GTP cyclohydrolase, FolE2/MptA family [Desulfurococcales archaeon]